MISDPVRARLVPVDDDDAPVEADALEFDFNPESLALRVGASLSSSSSRGLADTEATGRSTGTLTFDAVFDATRPPTSSAGASGASASIGLSAAVGVSASAGASAGVSVSAGASAGLSAGAGLSASASVGASLTASASIGIGGAGPPSDAQDVRSRTGRIALWVTGDPTESHPRPQRVQFQWGRIAYTGVIESFSETVDYFAPDGTALRSKVSLTIREAAMVQQVSAADRQSAALAAGFDVGAQLSLGFSASVGFGLSAGIGLGAGIDLGFSANAGLDLSASASLGVFGGAAASASVGAEVDVSSSPPALAAASASASLAPTPTPWAPNAPPAHTAAAALAALVQQQRSAGAATSQPSPAEGSLVATNLARASGSLSVTSPLLSPIGEALPMAGQTVLPVPILGAPPRRVPVSPVPRPIARAHDLAAPRRPEATRPRWEVLPSIDPTADPTADPDGQSCDCQRRPLCR